MGNYKHLNDHIYYSELYDKLTINDCEYWENQKDIHIENPKTKEEAERQSRIIFTNVAVELSLWLEKGERYLKKEEMIKQWMDRDRAKDEKLENAIEPKGIRCLQCSSPNMNCISRDLMTDSYDKEEVLFMFQCDKCNKRRAYWENGIEWQSKLYLCSKCQSEMDSAHIKKDNGVETTYSCQKCGHKETDSMDFSKKEEVVDPDFEMKRKKYCLSEEEGRKYSSEKINLEQMADLGKKWKEEEDNKELYDAIAKIKKLTVFELQNILSPICEKAGYVKLEFEKPEIQKDVTLGFSLQDSKSGRSEWDSVHDLQKLIRNTLKETNWRLMSDGVNYRLGFLTGKLRGVEGKEKLLNLVEKDFKKRDKLS
ncbi:MAG TPA: hypothetical protein DCS08_03560 [Candidatus Moranbacteria bacterium]|nr:MAG: hypothetical protein US27_C0022G0002 [Candidatus Moranbacteria bacterium GW2011_GWF1_36_78]HAT74057.1 hypothetical protein [Candidatus Moranbacteria bacterium]HBY11305.1 hypothetical protein [Candidatus Moranbacteria bacterium]